MKITTTIEVPVRVIVDQLVTAIEGGSEYWCSKIWPVADPKDFYIVAEGINNPKDYERASPWYDGTHLILAPAVEYNDVTELEGWFDVYLNEPDDLVTTSKDSNGNMYIRVGKERVHKGLELMSILHPKHFRDMMNEDGDADTSDVFLQLVALGEVEYG